MRALTVVVFCLTILLSSTAFAQSHRIAENETLFGLTADAWGLTDQVLADIQDANPNLNIDRVREGEMVIIPESPWEREAKSCPEVECPICVICVGEEIGVPTKEELKVSVERLEDELAKAKDDFVFLNEENFELTLEIDDLKKKLKSKAEQELIALALQTQEADEEYGDAPVAEETTSLIPLILLGILSLVILVLLLTRKNQ